MPCYTVVLTTVEFKVKNRELLEKAMSQLGMKFTRYDWGYYFSYGQINLDEGVVTMREGAQFQNRLNELKREYSKVCIEQITKAKRWRLKQVDKTKFQAVRL